MGGITDTQSLRFGYVGEPIDWSLVYNLADDIATQLDLADTAATAALQVPAAIVRRGTTLALAAGVAVSVPFTSEQQDTHGMVDIAGQPNRLTVSAASGPGLYAVTFVTQCDTTGWTRGDIIVNLNGAQYSRKAFFAPQPFGSMQVTMHMHLGTVGDFVTFQMYHETGGTTNMIEAYAYIFKLANN